jgi:hypothetical protein
MDTGTFHFRKLEPGAQDKSGNEFIEKQTFHYFTQVDGNI